MSKTVTINLVVLNGEKYIRHCLDSIFAQTYPHEFLEVNILDNGSNDNTTSIIETYGKQLATSNFGKFDLIESKKNLGMWPGQEYLFQYSKGEYILTLAVDVVLDKDFLANAVKIFGRDPEVGAVEPKIYRSEVRDDMVAKTDIIDTCGFKIFRSRRIINIGHGEEDKGQFNEEMIILGVEGAAPILRRTAVESCKINGKFIDHDYFWYGDDLDFAWRMTLFGWKQIYSPDVIAWHDRQTTKILRKDIWDFIRIRREIPLFKRLLDWQNVRFTIVKNDYIINVLKDLPWILRRELALFLYMLVFETKVILKLPAFFKLLPKMLRARKEIMKRAKLSPAEMRAFFE